MEGEGKGLPRTAGKKGLRIAKEKGLRVAKKRELRGKGAKNKMWLPAAGKEESDSGGPEWNWMWK